MRSVGLYWYATDTRRRTWVVDAIKFGSKYRADFLLKKLNRSQTLSNLMNIFRPIQTAYVSLFSHSALALLTSLQHKCRTRLASLRCWLLIVYCVQPRLPSLATGNDIHVTRKKARTPSSMKSNSSWYCLCLPPCRHHVLVTVEYQLQASVIRKINKLLRYSAIQQSQ